MHSIIFSSIRLLYDEIALVSTIKILDFPCSYTLQGTALAAGAGSIAGNALYGALKPDSDHKTVVIHENAPVAQAPVAQAPIPASPSSRKSSQETNEFYSKIEKNH